MEKLFIILIALKVVEMLVSRYKWDDDVSLSQFFIDRQVIIWILGIWFIKSIEDLRAESNNFWKN